ncbi:MAG TPA: hypothetical protein VMW75_08375, partial [Thermoanaerobaculia bacterium]|nr:hypothetical protein [Thermoanaerobaculia bacterium]
MIVVGILRPRISERVVWVEVVVEVESHQDQRQHYQCHQDTAESQHPGANRSQPTVGSVVGSEQSRDGESGQAQIEGGDHGPARDVP